MSLLNKIKILCIENNTSIAAIEKELSIGNGTISRWNKVIPSGDKLLKVADYFNVSVDYLLGRDQKETPTLTNKDERDIATKLDEMLGQLGSTEEALMFDGEPLDNETRELLRSSLKNQLEMTKMIAKQKYTPKKYRE